MPFGLQCSLPHIKGIIDTVQIADPAVGTDFSYSPPEGLIIMPLALQFRIVSGGVAGLRYGLLTFTRTAGNTFLTVRPRTAANSNMTFDFTYGCKGGYNDTGSSGLYPCPTSLPEVYIDEDMTMASLMTNLDALDQISRIEFQFCQWNK